MHAPPIAPPGSPVRAHAGGRRSRAFSAGVLVVAVAGVLPGGVGNSDDAASAAEPPDAVPTLFAIEPARLLDTRPGEPTVDGLESGDGPLAAGETLELSPVYGRGGIPYTGPLPYEIPAAMLTISAVDPTAPGFVTVHDCGSPRPEASSLNFRPGTVTNNNVLASIAQRNDGSVCIHTSAETHLVVDVSAYVPDFGAPIPIGPARLLETRTDATTIDGLFEAAAPRPADTTLELQITGRAGIPADARAAFVNVTAVNPARHGFVTMHACDDDRPLAAHLNHRPGVVTGNATLAPLDPDGRTCIYTSAETDLVVDVAAYVPAGAEPAPVAPARLLDTRPGNATADGLFEAIGPRTAHSTLPLQIAGRAGIPSDAVAAMVNITAVDPTDAGYVTIHPCNVAKPTASHLNHSPGAVTGNAVLVKLDRRGRACVYTRSDTDLVIDATGFVTSLASATEQTALEAIHTSTDGPNWTHRDRWILDADPCAWRGVTCDLDGVWALGLPNNGLSGPIPAEIGDLDDLERIFLVDNEITSLPDEIGELSELRRLILDDNALTSLPGGIGDLTGLTWLDIRDNRIASLPPEIGDLTDIGRLALSGNRIASLPAEIGDLTDIDVLDLSTNRIASLPPEIGDLTDIDVLDLEDNALTSLPPEIGGLTGMTSIELSRNRLTTLPPEIGQLTGLERLGLRGNLLTSVPSEFDALTGLRFLDLENNRLASTPTEIWSLTGLEALRLGRNTISTLPPDIGALAALRSLRVEDNRLESLPAALGTLEGLSDGWFQQNDLTGDLSPALAGIIDNDWLNFFLAGRGCPTISDPDVEARVEQLDPDWDQGCS